MSLRRGLFPSQQLVVRPAVPVDAAAAARLLEQGGHAAPASRLADSLGRVFDGRHVLLAERGGALVGLAVLQVDAGLHGEVAARLSCLMTDANHRHAGVGRRLVDEAARLARIEGCGALFVRAPNAEDALAAFYAALGFEQTHVTFDKKV